MFLSRIGIFMIVGLMVSNLEYGKQPDQWWHGRSKLKAKTKKDEMCWKLKSMIVCVEVFKTSTNQFD